VTRAGSVPADWYRTSFAPNFHSLYWEEGAVEKIDLVLTMLAPEGHEHVLDLACGSGTRTLELSRMGFDVIGVEPRSELLEVAGAEADLQGLIPGFFEEDPRYIDFKEEFDLVLSLGGGAFGHFDYDEEDLRAFRAAARALRPGGRLLMQTPNVLWVQAHLPERTWVGGSNAIDIIEQRWDAAIKRIDGTRRSLIECEFPEDAEAVPFQRRLYTVEELAEIFSAIGLSLGDVFNEEGARCAPSDVQQDLYVEARR
jgi:SAM-dependent methyltransferase